ncbi:MAG: antibiotic biosynthesis monooxygenase [Rhizobium sp.]|jgi:quinol monooxygenase YgiN|nr:MAG: antibiotic biosynthesis monooxygenase [Rhizobium sp.]
MIVRPKMLLLLAELQAKAESIGKVEDILRGLVDVTRDEPGNLVYAVHKPEDDPSRFVLYEIYKDRDACNKHLRRDSVGSALKSLEPLLARPADIRFFSTLAATGISSAE